MKNKGLKTKLEFRFNVDELEIPDMNFESVEPEKKDETKIRTVSKKKKRDQKHKELF